MPAARKTARTRQPRSYVVLALRGKGKDEGEVGDSWVPLGETTATTRDKAIDTIAGERIGSFKAVPTAAWKGGKAKVQGVLSIPLDEGPVREAGEASQGPGGQ